MDCNETFSSQNPERDLEYYKKTAALNIPGYRFEPTDGQLINYIHRKKQGLQFGNIFRNVLDLCNYDSDELQRLFKNGQGDELFLFTETKPLGKSRRVRKGRNGRWTSKSRAKKISHLGETLGYKKTLTYVEEGRKPIWKMQEYRLHHQSEKERLEDNLVLCKIYKQRGSESSCEAAGENISSIADISETDTNMVSSCKSLTCPTTVSNGLVQTPSDVGSTECIEMNHQIFDSLIEFVDLPTPINSNPDFSMIDMVINGNDPLFMENNYLFPESPIEDLSTPMHDGWDFSMDGVIWSDLFM